MSSISTDESALPPATGTPWTLQKWSSVSFLLAYGITFLFYICGFSLVSLEKCGDRIFILFLFRERAPSRFLCDVVSEFHFLWGWTLLYVHGEFYLPIRWLLGTYNTPNLVAVNSTRMNVRIPLERPDFSYFGHVARCGVAAHFPVSDIISSPLCTHKLMKTQAGSTACCWG